MYQRPLTDHESRLPDPKWKHEDHINGLELESVFLFLRRKMREKEAIGTRFLVLSDSQVAVGVLVKGRSSSSRLQRILRRVGGLLLGCHGYGAYGWVKSVENPADRPSRRWTRVKTRLGAKRRIGLSKKRKR